MERPTDHETSRRFFDPAISVVTLRVLSILTMRFVPDQLRRLVLHIPIGPCTVGREPTCDLVIPDITVSRHHCDLYLSESGLHVTDANSLHGVWVNGSMRKEYALEPGDILQIGDVIIVIEIRLRPAKPARPTRLAFEPSHSTKLLKTSPELAQKRARTISQRLMDLFYGSPESAPHLGPRATAPPPHHVADPAPVTSVPPRMVLSNFAPEQSKVAAVSLRPISQRSTVAGWRNIRDRCAVETPTEPDVAKARPAKAQPAPPAANPPATGGEPAEPNPQPSPDLMAETHVEPAEPEPPRALPLAEFAELACSENAEEPLDEVSDLTALYHKIRYRAPKVYHIVRSQRKPKE